MRRTLLAFLLAVAALAVAQPAAAAPGLLVGIDDDSVKWQPHAAATLSVHRDLGLGAARVTIPWSRGDTKPSNLVVTYLRRVAQLGGSGARLVVAVYGIPKDAPADDAARHQFCGFAQQVAARAHATDVVIWNEVNSAAYWPRSAGPAGYEALLAQCWDSLHTLRIPVNVITSTAAKNDPAGFVRAVGAAYRASGRTRPIADTFGHNPYPDNSAEPPWTRHPSLTTIGQGDLPTLLTALKDGFAGTDQPLPGESGVSVWYLEDGFQTTVPPEKAGLYVGRENDARPVPAMQASGNSLAVQRDQGIQLRDALLLAYCQPAVGAFFNFELVDEERLAGWQSGLLWRDGTRKPAYAAFKATVAQIAAGSVDCSQVRGSPENPEPLPVPPGVIGFTQDGKH